MNIITNDNNKDQPSNNYNGVVTNIINNDPALDVESTLIDNNKVETTGTTLMLDILPHSGTAQLGNNNDNIYNYDLPRWHHCNKNKRKSIDPNPNPNYSAYLTSLLKGRAVYNTESILEYIESHPVCAEQKNRDGDYPLHVACQYVNQNVIHDEDDNIIKKLIQLYKIAVTKPNDDGKLPLHIACNNGKSENVIMVLIEAFPDAANMSCVDNMTPLHYACSTVESKVVIDN